jgi:hypothetical protein
MNFKVHKATREQAKLRLAICGPTGSGKTFTALKVATEISPKVLCFDTESGSASKYASGRPFEFEVIDDLKVFPPDVYIEAIKYAEKNGYDVIVLDSLTHAWAGTGGLLEIVDDAAKRSKSSNSYTAWKEATPLHRKLIDAIVQSRIHVIATMRSEMEYVQERDERTGKTVIRKVGLAPVQRKDMSYEFDIVLDVDTDHVGVVTKSRCFELADKVFRKPGQEFADELKAWLSTGVKHVDPQPEIARSEPACEPTAHAEHDNAVAMAAEVLDAKPVEPSGYWTPAVASLVRRGREMLSKELGVEVGEDETRKWLVRHYDVHSHKQMTREMHEAMKEWMRQCLKEKALVL